MGRITTAPLDSRVRGAVHNYCHSGESRNPEGGGGGLLGGCADVGSVDFAFFVDGSRPHPPSLKSFPILRILVQRRGGNGVLCFSLDTRVRGYDVGRRGYDGHAPPPSFRRKHPRQSRAIPPSFRRKPESRGVARGSGVSLGGCADGGSVAFAFFVDGSDPDQVLGRSV